MGQDDEFGAFERNTKGIGMKLLLKMGYKKGQGLGKEGEGIVEPVPINLRQRNAGLGFDDSDGTNDPSFNKPRKHSSSLMRESEKQRKLFKKNIEFNGQTIENDDEVSVNDLSVGEVPSSAVLPLRFLEIELRTLVSQAKRRVSDEINYIESQKNTFENIRRELNVLENESVKLKSRQKIYTDMRRLFEDGLNDPSSILNVNSNLLLMQMGLGVLERVDHNGTDSQFSLSCIVGGVALFLMNDHIAGLTFEASNDHEFLSFLLKSRHLLWNWRKHLSEPVLTGMDDLPELMDPYQQIIINLILPRIRSVILENPIDAYDIVSPWISHETIFDSSSDEKISLLAPEVIFNLCITCIIPRIERFIMQDYIQTNQVSSQIIAKWIILLFDFRRKSGALSDVQLDLDPIYIAIQHQIMFFVNQKLKYSSLASTSHLDDKTGDPIAVNTGKIINVIEFWRAKIPNRYVEVIIKDALIPRLSSMILVSMRIDPADQEIGPLEVLMEFSKIVTLPLISQILTKSLIPKLKSCVTSWIAHEHANLNEVADWYLAWKAMMPPTSQGMQYGLADLLMSIDATLDRL